MIPVTIGLKFHILIDNNDPVCVNAQTSFEDKRDKSVQKKKTLVNKDTVAPRCVWQKYFTVMNEKFREHNKNFADFILHKQSANYLVRRGSVSMSHGQNLSFSVVANYRTIKPSRRIQKIKGATRHLLQKLKYCRKTWTGCNGTNVSLVILWLAQQYRLNFGGKGRVCCYVVRLYYENMNKGAGHSAVTKQN